jgi:hypothetical protein
MVADALASEPGPAPLAPQAAGRPAAIELAQPPAPRVQIGRLEVIVVAPSDPAPRPARPRDADLASRRYLRQA